MTNEGNNRLNPAGSGSRPGSAGVTIRGYLPEDAPALVDLYNRQEAESGPRSVDVFRRAAEEQDDAGGACRLVATKHGRVIGYAEWQPAWWTGRNDVYAVEIRVEYSRWGRGIGSSLHHSMLSQPFALDATRLLGWIRVESAEAQRFAGRHGFEATGQMVEECRLHLPEARTERATDLAARLDAESIRIVTLAERGQEEPFLRALQRLWNVDEAADETSFESWRSSVLEGAGLSPATHWVALDGERPVGTTFLKRLDQDGAENDYTAVAPSHRGRGIAYALKLQAIFWGREHGIRWFYTSSLIENTPMIAINRRLGYRPGIRKQEVARDLVAGK